MGPMGRNPEGLEYQQEQHHEVSQWSQGQADPGEGVHVGEDSDGAERGAEHSADHRAPQDPDAPPLAGLLLGGDGPQNRVAATPGGFQVGVVAASGIAWIDGRRIGVSR